MDERQQKYLVILARGCLSKVLLDIGSKTDNVTLSVSSENITGKFIKLVEAELRKIPPPRYTSGESAASNIN